MKKLGIVVPIFNAELYLEKCVESILNQTYTNLEVVLVDDGSTDKSSDMCDLFGKKDDRVHVIHQENAGKISARYHGVQSLDCEYVTFVDADDWIDENAYKKMERHFENDIDIISFQIIRYFDEEYQYISESGYEAGYYGVEEIREQIFPTMIYNELQGSCGLDPSLANKIIKKHLLLEALQNVTHLDVSYGDDVATIYPLMLKAQSIVITNENLYYHRKRKGNDIAPYFADSGFYKKLSNLYDYLVFSMGQDYNFVKQLDFFYEISVKSFLNKYGKRSETITYLFPFDKVSAGKRIVLYGASKVGQTYYEQIKRIHYGEIAAWIDRSYIAYEKLGVGAVESLWKIRDYDYIVIAIAAYEIAEKVKQDLISMGVDKEKIVWSI